jgi:LCP family protein required for cell wall assembly
VPRYDGEHAAGRHRSAHHDVVLPARFDPRGRRRSPAGLTAKVLAAMMSLTVLAVSGYAWATYRSAVGHITHLSALPTTHNHAGKSDVDGSDQNILVIGDDSRNGLSSAQLAKLATQSDGGGVNTDTMMLIHVPADGSQASVVSLPRDLWVDVPGHGNHKLNDAFNLGSNARTDSASRTAGFRLLIETISDLTGLHIDHFVEVNLWGFYSISEAVGGIQVDLCQAVDDSYSGVDLPAGVSTIKGTQALAFVRQRHGLVNGDLDRVRRQQYFIGAVFRKLQSADILLNPIKLNRLLNAVTSVLTTDPGLDPIKLADQMRGLTAGNLKFTTIPITGEPKIDGQDVVTYDPATVKALFATLSHPVPVKPKSTAKPKSTPTAKAATESPSKIVVSVRNGNGTPGIATQTASALRSRGFRATLGQDLPNQSTTEIHYTASDITAAHTLAKLIPNARLVADPDAGPGLQLDLGSDFSGLGGANSTSTSASTADSTAHPATRSAADRSCIY